MLLRKIPHPTLTSKLHRFVSSTSLSATFNSRPSTLLKKTKGEITGLFGIPELTSPSGFAKLKEECIHNSGQFVSEACLPRDQRTRLVSSIFDDLSDELCRVADLAEFVRQAHPQRDMALAAEDACISISGLVEKLNTHLGLYNALDDVVANGDDFAESEVDKHVAKLFLHDFKQCGIHLDDESRQMVVKLNDYILQIGQQFAANTHRPSIADKSQVPNQVLNYFNIEGQHVVQNGLYVESANELAREVAYKLYYQFNKDQEALLSELLVHRHHLAQLCGYPTFGHRAMKESLAGDPETVDAFMGHLSKNLKTRVQEDLDVMLNMKKRTNPMAKAVEMWDVPYFTQKAKQICSSSHVASKISEYFSLGTCMEGLSMLYKTLFRVELTVEPVEEGELWHPDVYKVSVRDLENGGQVLGQIYCDFFTRPEKPYQDCHFTIRGGRQMANGEYQNPIVVLMLNLPSPGWLTPTFMSGSMIDNLFHEMGHAMHSMLGRTKYQHVTGTRCSTDFAEVPSTLMEYFSSDPRVLSKISCHYRTGERLSEEEAERFCSAKKIFHGIDIQTQLFYSTIDQKLHGAALSSPYFDSDKNFLSSTSIVRDLHETHMPLAYHPNTAWHHRFSHLVGYGARYYSYLMARAVAASIWQRCFIEDPFSEQFGKRYRDECLSHGGGKPSRLLVSDFLGESFSQSDHLAEALIKEVDAKREATNRLLTE